MAKGQMSTRHGNCFFLNKSTLSTTLPPTWKLDIEIRNESDSADNGWANERRGSEEKNERIRVWLVSQIWWKWEFGKRGLRIWVPWESGRLLNRVGWVERLANLQRFGPVYECSHLTSLIPTMLWLMEKPNYCCIFTLGPIEYDRHISYK